MDPTDIVLVPIDLHSLTIFVSHVTLVGFFGSLAVTSSTTTRHGGPKVLLSLLGQWIVVALTIWFVSVVCGTPPTQTVRQTVWASGYMATLLVLFTTITNPQPQSSRSDSLKSNTTNASLLDGRHLQRILGLPIFDKENLHDFYTNLMATCQAHATAFVTVPFAVLRLYDWGSQIQRWPLPMILGSTYGFVAGSLLGSILVVILHVSPTMQQCYQNWTTCSTSIVNNKHQD